MRASILFFYSTFWKIHMKRLSSVIICFLCFGLPSDGLALTIIRDYIGGTAAQNTVGGGNLEDIFNAAADMWELAILDTYQITIHYGWTEEQYIGVHWLREQGGTPNRETEGEILFGSQYGEGQKYEASWYYFMDPTPYDSEEYELGYYTYEWDLGGGVINTGRSFRTGSSGIAATSYDLFSVALHEIGHALGLTRSNAAFRAEGEDGDIDVSDGTVIPLASNIYGLSGHFEGVYFNSVMGTDGYGPGSYGRNVLSAVDILAVAQVSGFTDLNLDPIDEFYSMTQTPLPPSILIFGSGLFFLVGLRKKTM